LPGACPAHLHAPSGGWGEQSRSAKRDVSRERARVARLGTRVIPVWQPKGSFSRNEDHSAGKRRWDTGARVGTFRSAEVDRTHRGRDDHGRYPAHTETRGLARTSRTWRSDAQAATDLERQRCASQLTRSSLPEDTPGSRCVRKPRRDRIRRGAGSGTREVPGPRARSYRYDGRVSGSWTCLSKQGVRSRLWLRG